MINLKSFKYTSYALIHRLLDKRIRRKKNNENKFEIYTFAPVLSGHLQGT